MSAQPTPSLTVSGREHWRAERQAFARLLGRWEDFFAWLGGQEGFDSEPMKTHSDGGLDAELDFCPVHSGDSGEAWHFFEDAWLNGGSVCNTCGPFSHGIALLNQVYDPEQVFAWVERYVQERRLPDLPEKAPQRLWAWHTANHAATVVQYLRNRGIPISQDSLPMAVRGAHDFKVWGPKGEDYGRRPVALTLIRNSEGVPVTYQMIVLTADRQKAKDIPKDHVKRTAGLGERRALSGGYADLGATQGSVLIVLEGMETGLAVRHAFRSIGLDPMIRATLGGGAATQLAQNVPEGVTCVLVGSDADMFQPFFKQAARRGGPLLEGAHQVLVAVPEAKGNPRRDFLDVLVEEGVDAILESFAAAVPVTEQALYCPEPTSALRERPRRYGVSSAKEIDLRQLTPTELYASLDEALFIKLPRNWAIQNGQVVGVYRGSVRVPPPEELATLLESRRVFLTKQGYQPLSLELVRKWWARPSLHRNIEKQLTAEGKIIARIIARPVLVPVAEPERIDGALSLRAVETSGVDTPTGLGLSLASSEEVLWVSSEVLTQPQAQQLFEQIMQKLFGRLVFAEGAASIAAAALFAPLLRECAATPLFVCDAPLPIAGQATLGEALISPWGPWPVVAYEAGELHAQLSAALKDTPDGVLIDGARTEDLLAVTDYALTRFADAPHRRSVMVLDGEQLVLNDGLKARSLTIRAADGWSRRLRAGVGGSYRRALYQIARSWLAHAEPYTGVPRWPLSGFADWSRLSSALLDYLRFPEDPTG